MKQKLLMTFALTVALSIGFALGRLGNDRQGEWLKEGDVENLIDQKASNQAMFNIHALSLIRSERVKDAAQFLEERLDYEIVTFLRFDNVPEGKRSDACKLALKHVHDYRKKYPWRNPITEVDMAVQRLLADSQ